MMGHGAVTDILTQLQEIPLLLDCLWSKGSMQALRPFCQALLPGSQFVLQSLGLIDSILPEAALKLTETSALPVYANNTESFKHGPKVILSSQPNCIYLIPPEPSEQIFRHLESHFWKNGQQLFDTQRVFLIRFPNSPSFPEGFLERMSIPESHIFTCPNAVSLLQSIFVSLVLFQLMSCVLTQLKGDSPDNPALSKAVLD
jgi:glucosamine 6-phosphate synthetase-like amidotransferase/phosphosugar isomerase protein